MQKSMKSKKWWPIFTESKKNEKFYNVKEKNYTIRYTKNNFNKTKYISSNYH